MWDSYDITRGGWNFDPGPDTWLSEHFLAPFNGRHVRITIGDLGPSRYISDPSQSSSTE
jgi:hypothetical protein